MNLLPTTQVPLMTEDELKDNIVALQAENENLRTTHRDEVDRYGELLQQKAEDIERQAQIANEQAARLNKEINELKLDKEVNKRLTEFKGKETLALCKMIECDR